MIIRRLLGLLLLAGAPLLTARAFAQDDVDVTRTMSSEALRSVFHQISAAASRSTVLVFGENLATTHQVALGTVITGDGYILTKASEVTGQPRLWVVVATAGMPHNYNARVVGVRDPEDLAMLKIDATGLTPIDWADTTPPPVPPAGARGAASAPSAAPVSTAAHPHAVKVEVGEWVASVGPGASAASTAPIDDPIAVGVLSVGRRKINREPGYLGITFDSTVADRARIELVVSSSPAEEAGFKGGDVITAIDGKATHTYTEVRAALIAQRAGDNVIITVQRDGQRLLLRPILGPPIPPSVVAEEQLVSGAISSRSSDFAAVYQHDAVIRPAYCGGPIVDLQGRVLGINIARVSRTETYALPADLIVPLLEPLESGQYAPASSAPAKPGQ